jgi:outer membrane protein assembly factor BamB
MTNLLMGKIRTIIIFCLWVKLSQGAAPPHFTEMWRKTPCFDRASAAIGSDGTVYVGVNDGTNKGLVFALNPNDGSEKWRLPIPDGKQFNGSATFHNNILYIGTVNTFYALDCNNQGNKLWEQKYQISNNTRPVIANNTVYFGTGNGKFYALDINNMGQKKWEFNTTQTFSTPTLAGNLIYFGCDKKVYAINATNGTKKWDFLTGGAIDSQPAIHKGKLYVGSADNHVYMLDANNGTQINRSPTDSNTTGVLSSPTIANNTVYIGTDAGTGSFFAFNLDLTLKWKLKPPSQVGIGSKPYVAPNGVVYIGSGDNHLYAIRDDRTQGTELGKFDAKGSIHSRPAPGANGTLYFGSDRTFYALNIPKSQQQMQGGTPIIGGLKPKRNPPLPIAGMLFPPSTPGSLIQGSRQRYWRLCLRRADHPLKFDIKSKIDRESKGEWKRPVGTGVWKFYPKKRERGSGRATRKRNSN